MMEESEDSTVSMPSFQLIPTLVCVACDSTHSVCFLMRQQQTANNNYALLAEGECGINKECGAER